VRGVPQWGHVFSSLPDCLKQVSQKTNSRGCGGGGGGGGTYEFASGDPEQGIEVLSDERLSVPFLKLVYSYSPDFAIYDPAITDDVIARIEDANVFLANQGLISQKVDLNRFIDKSYYEAVLSDR